MQFPCMQTLPLDQCAMVRLKSGVASSINGISKKWMTDGGHMHADLVGPTRLQLTAQKRKGIAIRFTA